MLTKPIYLAYKNIITNETGHKIAKQSSTCICRAVVDSL